MVSRTFLFLTVPHQQAEGAQEAVKGHEQHSRPQLNKGIFRII